MDDADEKKVKLEPNDEEDHVVLKYQIENLKVALKFSNDALTAERKQKLSDRKHYEAKIAEVKTKYRKIYEDKVHENEKFCNNKFMDINAEHEAKVKSMEDDHDKTLKLLHLSRQTLPDQSPQPSQEFVSRSQQTTPGIFVDNSNQTFANPSADLSVQTEQNDEEPAPNSSEVAAIVDLQAEIAQLKQNVAELVFENNRYHLAISNCTYCASDDVTSDASISLDASIRASTPVSSALPSSGLGPALFTRTIPALMSLTVQDMRQAKVDNNVKKSKNKTFIFRMVKTLDKLETKYLAPRHKRKRRQFTNKQNTSPMTPKTQASSIYYVLLAPEPEKLSFPEPFHHVKWNDTRLKPALPYPESCPVHSCSPNHGINVDYNNETDLFHSLAEDSVEYANKTELKPPKMSTLMLLEVEERGYRGGLRGRRGRERRGAPDL